LQATVAASRRGRTISLFMLAMRGGMSIGSLLTGISVSLIGVRYALLINGVLALMVHIAIGRRCTANCPLPRRRFDNRARQFCVA
jgi:MFS family permease